MYCLTVFCGVCLNKEEQYRTILMSNSDDAQLLHKLNTCTFATDFLDINRCLHVCNKCLATLQVAYGFIEMCHKNSEILRGYVAQLSHVSASTIHPTELIAPSDIKQEYVEECTTEQNIKQSEYLKSEIYYERNIDLPLLNEQQGEIWKEPVIVKKEILQTGRVELNDLEQEDINESTTEQIYNRNKYLNSEYECSEDHINELQCKIKEEILTDSQNEHLNNKPALLSCRDIDVGNTSIQKAVLPTDIVQESQSEDVASKFKCNTCRMFFISINDLKSHALVHVAQRKHQCTVCGKRFLQSAHLRAHERIHTGAKPFHCTVCEKRFAYLDSLTRHNQIHTGEKRFQCNICEKRFRESCTLKDHMTIHTGKKKYQCTVCQKEMSQSSSLKVHMLTHTGEKKFPCTICGLRCALRSGLKLHMRIHTGEKKFQCTLCEKRFTRNFSLTLHMRIHTGEKRYECTVCQTKFVDLAGMRRHKLHHEKNTID